MLSSDTGDTRSISFASLRSAMASVYVRPLLARALASRVTSPVCLSPIQMRSMPPLMR